MRSIKEIKHDYRFSAEDEKRLADLLPLMEAHTEHVMSTVNLWIMGTKGVATHFNDETRQRHVFQMQKKWFLNLFNGRYENQFYESLLHIGAFHGKRNIDVHFMSRVHNIVKNSCIDIIQSTEEEKQQMIDKIVTIGKIIDISLNVMTTSYIEEELRTYSPVYKVKSALISFSERFAQATNLVLILALIGLTIGVIWMFIKDVGHLMSGNLSEGIISSLGSMLLLWVLIELMNTEISHLKGGKFHISVFVGVALVTTIREMMIATLKHESTEVIYYLIVGILVVGFIYWLVVKAEEKTR